MKVAWIGLAAVLWPLVHLGIFVARFGESPPPAELLYFAPTGLLCGIIVSALVGRAQAPAQARAALVGAGLALPLGLAGNVLGGLAGPIGVTVLGTIPVAAGAALGWSLRRPKD